MNDELGAWTLARLLVGAPVETLDLEALAEPWRDLADRVVGANGDRKASFLKAIAGREDAGKLEAAVFAVDPSMPFNFSEVVEASNETEIHVNVPDLPASAQLSDVALMQSERVGKWLTSYVEYADERSPMTPRLFHESSGLWLGSVAIARRLYCALPHDRVWPNLYVLWVAPTTLFAKSTAFKIPLKLASDAFDHLLLPQQFTPEALLSELAGKDPAGLDDLPQETRDLLQARRNFAAQRGLIVDEFSGILASAKKDYNAGLTETILRLHDCPSSWERRTQTHGLIRICAAYTSLLSATTPMALSPHLTKQAWLNGFWPRFALLMPCEERPEFKRTERAPVYPSWLSERLSWLACKALPFTTFPTPPESREVALTDDAYESWKHYDRAVRYDLLTDDLDASLWGLYGRLPTQGIKVAVILAALDWSGEEDPVITLAHWAKAQQIVESWRASAHRLLIPSRLSEERHREERVLSVIRRAGQQGATIRDVYRVLNMERNEVDAVINHLLKDDIVTEICSQPTRKGGRPTSRYAIA